MEKNIIENEIKELLKIQYKWRNTFKSKSKAYCLLSEIAIFKHTFSTNFPHFVEHFKRNSHAEIYFTDGISELERYSESKLKVKDDVLFHDGLKNICYGFNSLIIDLKIEKNMN